MQVPRLVSYITHSFRVAAFTQTLPGELGCSSQNDETYPTTSHWLTSSMLVIMTLMNRNRIYFIYSYSCQFEFYQIQASAFQLA